MGVPPNRLKHLREGGPGPGNGAEDLRDQMARLRESLRGDVVGVKRQAKEKLEWRHYLRRYPVMSLSAAALIGYLIVPTRRQTVQPTDAQLEKLINSGRLHVTAAGVASRASKPSRTHQALTTVGSLASKALVAYLIKRAGDVADDAVSDPSPEIA